jgi:excisionase family DNA binding protein
MDTHRDPTNMYRAWQDVGPQAVSHAEVGRLLAHLEQRLVGLDRVHREIAEDAQALANTAAATPEDRDVAGARSVYSVRAAATELGVSVSMLHKLLKQRRLGHLKAGARTLITAEHLEQFREASEVPALETDLETSPEQPMARLRLHGAHRPTRARRSGGTCENEPARRSPRSYAARRRNLACRPPALGRFHRAHESLPTHGA